MSGLPVYTGFWRNWGDGEGSGTLLNLTLTVPRAQGALIVAFLALFLSASVAQIWPILCFVIHQSRSTPSPRLGLYHQQQAVLSNTLSPSAAAVSFAKLAWTWRRAHIKGTTWSSTLLLLAATLSLVVLAAAGLATSKIQVSSDEVLTVSDTCGWSGGTPYVLNSNETEQAPLTMEELLLQQIAYTAWARWTASNSLEYVRSCYRFSSLSEKCQTFTKPSLPLASINVACPFAEDICGLPEAFQVDTGFMDSNKDLGINSNEADRLRIRKVMACVPIAVEEKFSTPWTDERLVPGVGLEGDMYKYYDIGNRSGLNYTLAVSNFSVSSSEEGREKQVLSLGAAYYIPDIENPQSSMSFTPIPELEVPDSDIAVLFLGNNARYFAPVEDPWFRATNTSDPTGAQREVPATKVPLKLYISDRIISAMACTEQYQFCSGDTCSDLAGIRRNDTTPWRGLRLSAAQKAVFNLAHSALSSVTLPNGAIWIGPSILRANEFLWFGDGDYLSTSLPPNHWKDEVTNFMQVMTAAMQRLVVEFATKSDLYIHSPDGPVDSKEFLVRPTNQEEWDMCGRIRIRDARFANFSVFGLAMTLAVGIVVTVINMCMLPRTGFWLQRKLHVSSYGEREWRAGHLFMQQRDALEGKGVGPWRIDERTSVPWIMPQTVGHGGLLDDEGRTGQKRPEEVILNNVTR